MINRYTWRSAVLETLLWIIAGVLFAIPIYVLVNVALKPARDRHSGLAWPAEPHWENFATAWVEGKFTQAFATSIFVTAISVTLIVVISAMAAYPLARISRRWSKGVLGLFIAGIIVPGSLGMIPLYLQMRDVGLIGSIWALVIIYVGGGIPFTVFLYTIFLRALPPDFEEAALIDGCPPWRAFLHVVFPLMRPVTGTIVVLQTIGIYNDFFTPLLYLSGTDFTTLPLALKDFAGKYYTDWGVIFAGLIMAVVPILLFYLALQKHIIRGFAGGLKG